MTDTQWGRHIVPRQTQEGPRRLGLAWLPSPRLSCIFADAHGWWEGRGAAKTQKRGVQGRVRKRVEGLPSPEEQSQLHLGQMAQKRRRDSCDGAGQEGGFAPGLGHIEDSGGSSPAVTPCIRQGEPRGGWRPSRGLWPLGGYTETAFVQLFRPALGQDEGNVGTGRRERKDGFAERNAAAWKASLAQPPPAGGRKERRDVGRSPFCSQPALLPSHRGLSH